MSERFFLNVDFQSGQQAKLTGQEAHHLLNVMRAKAGDWIQVFDGRGGQADAQIETCSRKDVQIRLDDVQQIDLRPSKRILMVVAAAKGDRLRFLVEKMTELGATAWLPLQSQRTVNSINPSTEKKIQQWTIDACKQSQRNHLLDILPAAGLSDVLLEYKSVPSRWLAAAPKDLECNASAEKTSADATSSDKMSSGIETGTEPAFDQVVVVGPEGGFTEDEVRMSLEAGYQAMPLGKSVLRIETAALALLTHALFSKP